MKRFSNVPPLKIKMGKGPLSKNGKTPWAAGTMYALTKSKLEGGRNDMSPVNFNIKSLIGCLTDPDVLGIEVIDDDNIEYVITKEL